MLISLNWLKRYTDLNRPIDEISEALTMLGLEVEGIKKLGLEAEGVVCAEVLACEKHPNADKLKLCRVFDGNSEVSVVCGAPNVTAGQKVLLAKPGAILPGGHNIKHAKIRGVESFGMICAEDEVGLGESHEGILELPSDVVPGTPMEEVDNLCDVIYELNVTPNRPDALSHFGVARELAARFSLKLESPYKQPLEQGKPAEEDISIEINAEDGCSKYVGRVIRNVKIGPSPAWMVKLLESVGQKSINNVVDATNFVLLELGQPSHAFDMDSIRGKKIEIRYGKGENLVTLDEQERKVNENDLVIADAENAVCLAGVMGGIGTEVSEKSSSIFLEVASFNPSLIRKQSKKQGLVSESSYRFERGVDPFRLEDVNDYLAALIAEIAGGNVAPGRLVAETKDHPRQQKVVSLRFARCNKILGTEIEPKRIVNLLSGIGLIPNDDSDPKTGVANFKIPGFRPDLEREVDLIEEVSRLVGLDEIPQKPLRMSLQSFDLPKTEELSQKLRLHLSERGWNETIRLRFGSSRDLDALKIKEDDPRRKCVSLKNPINEEWQNLQSTLIPGLLQAVSYNQKNREKYCRLFEVSKTFFSGKPDPQIKTGVEELEKLGLVCWGEWKESSWQPGREMEFYFLKGVIEDLLARIGKGFELKYDNPEPFFHPIESGNIFHSGKKMGSFGMVHPAVAKNFNLKGSVGISELDLTKLSGLKKKSQAFSPFSQYTSTIREMNLLVDEKLTHQEILSIMPLKGRQDLRDVRLNSVYRGKGIPEGKKALHYSFTYQSMDKTLTDEEVNKVQESLAKDLQKDPRIDFK